MTICHGLEAGEPVINVEFYLEGAGGVGGGRGDWDGEHM